tara:strand:- start:3576 stop:4190 length:615 start_codon:yes stop_codon:yes gene_type:complete
MLNKNTTASIGGMTMTKSRGDRVEICKKCRSISSLYKGFWLGLNFGTPGGPVEEVDLYCSQCSSLEPETVEVYARQCTFCSKGFSQGYLSGDEYFCNQECEVNQCIKRQSCKCFEVLVKEIDTTKLATSDPQWLKMTIKGALAKDLGQIELTSKQWYEFIETEIGSDYFEKLDNEWWYWSEWDLSDCIGDMVYTSKGKEYFLED